MKDDVEEARVSPPSLYHQELKKNPPNWSFNNQTYNKSKPNVSQDASLDRIA